MGQGCVKDILRSLPKKSRFTLRISSVNVTKSAVSFFIYKLYIYKLYHTLKIKKDNHQVTKIIRVPGNKTNPEKIK